MKNCKPLDKEDKYVEQTQILFDLYNWSSTSSRAKYVMPYEVKKEDKTFFISSNLIPANIDSYNLGRLVKNHLIKKGYVFKKEFVVDSYKLTKINKQVLFIAAPKSHFNLEGLDKKLNLDILMLL